MRHGGSSIVLTIALALLGAGAAAAPAFAQTPDDAARRRQKEFEKLEENVLRSQLENFINEGARWDEKSRRIVFKEKNDLGGMEMPLGLILQQLAEPGEDGRLHVKKDVKLRPFMRVIQDFIAEGGMEDIEKIQRLRREGVKGNPFKDGVPPRVTKAIAGLLRALNEQGRGEGDDGERVAGDEKKSRERSRERASGIEDMVRERIAERLGSNPEEIEQQLRVLRDFAAQAERDIARIRKDLERRLEEFAKSERGERLRRRAESEMRRVMESDETREMLADAQKRAMEWLSGEEGRDAQRRLYEFLESERGRDLRRRLDEFLQSENGKKAAERMGDLFERLRGNPFEDRSKGADGARAKAKADAEKAKAKAREDGERRRERKPGVELF